MSIATLPGEDDFRTQPIRGLPDLARVDRQKQTIFGAKAMQSGPLNEGDARPWKVDGVTLNQLQELINQRNNGVKMRFAHPNMSRDGMGRHLGRATNARIVGEGEDAYLAVDPVLSDTAKRSPSGDLTNYVLSFAEECPEDFGLSVAPLLDREAMGKIEPDENGLVPIRLKAVRAIDFVDEPAATRGGLFSIDSDSEADLPAQATWLLDTFFGGSSPEVIRGRFDEFINSYFLAKGNPMPENTDYQEILDAKDAEIEALKTQVGELSATDTNANGGDNTDTPDEDSNLESKKELTRRAEITALCKLAKVDDEQRDLMISAGFDRADAQDFLKNSGALSAANPPVDEGGTDPAGTKKTPEEKFGTEFDQDASAFSALGVTRDDYIASRKIDEGIAA